MFGSHVKLIATFGAVCLIALFLFRLEDPLALSRAAITNLASSPIAIVDDTADIEEALEPAAAEGADEHVKESKRAEEEEPAEPAVVEPSPSSTVSRRPTSPSASKSTTAPKAEPPSSPSHAPALRPERQPHVSPPSSTAQNASESSSGRLIMHMGPDSCGAVSYMTGATNCNLGPPYFHPTNCVARKWSAEQAAECLRGSNIFVIGNSVARQYMYELGHVLNGYDKTKDYTWGAAFDAAKDRVRQKLECAKAPNPNQDSHAQSCEVSYSPITRVHYIWRQWFMDGPQYADTAMEGDYCLGTAPELCISRFLSSSKPGDLLLFQLGLAYARYLKLDITKDVAGYMSQQAQLYVDMIKKVWKGSYVLAVNTSPMKGDGWPPGTNDRAKMVNDAIIPVFQRAGWPVVDQWTINQGHDDQYSDPAHFPTEEGKCLSQAMWQHALSLICPLDLGEWPAGYKHR